MRTFIAIALLVALVAAQLPESYNVRDKYPQCTIPILNQGSCGSCWAHSVVEALSERFCIHSNGQLKPLLSQQYLANCDTGSSGCGGGDTLGAYNYIKNHGIDQSSCTAYTSGKTGKTGACPATCDGGEAIIPQDLFKVTDAYSLSTGDIKKNVESMQQDILKNGPISASFLVRQDFLDFFRNNATKDGIYYSHGGRILGGHAIMIVGWGVGKVNDTVIPYWQAVNSWGPEWGDHGMFKIIRGSDDCNIESRKLSAGIPDVGKNSTLIFKRPPVFGKIKAELNNDDVCDGCWTTQTIDEEMHEKVQSMVGSYNYNIVNEVIEVKTRVANGVMYKIAVQASNDRNEVKKMYIVAHESATSDDINVLSVQH